MNLKRAKRMRKFLRIVHDINVREVTYEPRKPVHAGPANLEGWNPGAMIWSGQAKLDPGCGRAKYHALKRSQQ